MHKKGLCSRIHIWSKHGIQRIRSSNDGPNTGALKQELHKKMPNVIVVGSKLLGSRESRKAQALVERRLRKRIGSGRVSELSIG